MAKRHDGHLVGPIKDRTQYHNENTDMYTVRNTENGQFMRGKQGAHYKNITKEN